MSREILFKAKTCSGEWVEGLLAHKDDKWYISNKAGMPFAFEVRPETICQYTGLTDENGNKIWENDIAVRRSSQEEFIGKIIYDRNGSLCHREFQTDYEALLIGSVTVIGNIFDNPELIKGSEQE